VKAVLAARGSPIKRLLSTAKNFPGAWKIDFHAIPTVTDIITIAAISQFFVSALAAPVTHQVQGYRDDIPFPLPL
jgi:hypothetical protein